MSGIGKRLWQGAVKLVSAPVDLAAAVASFGLKTIKYHIDDKFRKKVQPVPGSVVYSELYWAAEHSGIYVDDGQISNIVVDGVAESTVRLNNAASFTAKSQLTRKIYVSCGKYGAVGDGSVAYGAHKHVGERNFYGLVFENCHSFSTRCLDYTGVEQSAIADCIDWVKERLNVGLDPTIRQLKADAESKLGATKWRLWDWQAEGEYEPEPEPDWQAQEDFFKNQPMSPAFIEALRQELADTQAYIDEISDEQEVPEDIRQRLVGFGNMLQQISEKYEEVKQQLPAFATGGTGAGQAPLSYNDVQACGADFAQLAEQMRNNAQIKELVRKMGRNYISEEKKKQVRIPQAGKNEVHGIHRSNDLMRLLPAELVNLDDDTLETLFYARLLESNLLCYELKGTDYTSGEETEKHRQRTGPVVACLDTSGSMQGQPLLKAKALLFAIAGILRQENRSLHVLLFGSSGEIKEYAMPYADATADKTTGRAGGAGTNGAGTDGAGVWSNPHSLAGLMQFLQQGFGGGTDFETPLQRALTIIREEKAYKKADVLMISDGDCGLSAEFTAQLQQQKQELDCTVYSVLCAGTRVEDGFSDEVVVL